jgi:hypothetical protein
MTTVHFPESSAIQSMDPQEDNIVTITFKSGKAYNYVDTTGNFVQTAQNIRDNGKSVGQFFNRALKEDQTLQIIAI